MITKKKCTKCNRVKELVNFKTEKLRIDGYSSWCKKCHSKKTKQWQHKNTKKSRNAFLKRNYGITQTEYDNLLYLQHGVCAVCEQPETVRQAKDESIRPLVVDHCHATGKIRGLLCANCNSAEGYLKSNYVIALKMAEYIKRHSQ